MILIPLPKEICCRVQIQDLIVDVLWAKRAEMDLLAIAPTEPPGAGFGGVHEPANTIGR